MGLGNRQAGDELLGERRIALDVLLGEPDATHVCRDPALHSCAAERELRRAAADVEDKERPVSRIELSGGSDEREPCFFIARNELGPHADSRLGYVEEGVPVAGVPRC